jgi:SAM-dependent methyltransferase
MIWSPQSARDSTLSPEELAEAMRNGLEARRYFRRPPEPSLTLIPAPPGSEFVPRLLDHAGVLGLPAPPGRGLRGKLVRAVRRVVKRLMNPWLDEQTRFNHTTYELARSMHWYLALLSERLNELRLEVQKELTAGRKLTHQADNRLNELFFDVNRLRRRLAEGEPSSPDPYFTAAPTLVDPVHVIEGLFLHTRLTPPPGRVLAVGSVGLHGLDLASLGYQVVQLGLAHEPLDHPEIRVAKDADCARLPFPDETFDWVVVLSGEGHPAGLTDGSGPRTAGFYEEVARVLTPGGQAAGSFIIHEDGLAPPDVARRIEPLGLTETAYAERAGHGWSLAAEPSGRSELVLWIAARE